MQDHDGNAWNTIVAAIAQGRDRVDTAIQDARARAALRAELELLDEHGLVDPILDEIGLSRRGIPSLLDAYPGARRRFAEMTQRLGIDDVAEPDPHACRLDRIAGSQRKCLFCPSARQCEAWLRTGASDGYRAFCPNSRTFDRLQAAKQPQAA